MSDAANDKAADSAPAPASGFMGVAGSIGARNLIVIIITMPLVFLLVVMATIALFGRPGAEKGDVRRSIVAEPLEILDQPAPLRAAAPASPAAASHDTIALKPGEDISAMALDGDRLVLRVRGEGGGEIIVYDLALGAIVRRVAVEATAGGL